MSFALSHKKPQINLKNNVIETPFAAIFDNNSLNENENSLKEDVGNLEKWFNDQKVKILNKNTNEKDYLTEAKNQIMRKRLETENEKFKTSQEPIVNQLLVNFSLFDKNLENFQENEKNTEKIKEFSRKNKKIFTFKDEETKAKKYEPIKSLDAIKNEFRKQIFNQIIADKIIKKKKAESPMSQTELLNDQISIAFEKVPSFKCLQQQVSNQNLESLIVMDFLKDKLNEFQQKPKKMFELGAYEAQFNKITNDLKSLEEILLEKFNEISNDIEKKKKMGHSFRNIHSNLSITIKRLYDEKDVLIGKFNTIEQKLLSNLGEKDETQKGGVKSKGQLTNEFMRLEVFYYIIFKFFFIFYIIQPQTH